MNRHSYGVILTPLLLVLGTIVVIAVALGLSSLRNASVIPSPIPSPLPTPIPSETPLLGDAKTREECLDRYGIWQKWGLTQQEYCQIPAHDAGKPCTDGSQCSLGKCISEFPKQLGGCQKYKNTFGCFSFIEDGKTQGAICID